MNANNRDLEARALAAHRAEIEAVRSDIERERGLRNQTAEAEEFDPAEAGALLSRIVVKQRPANSPKLVGVAATSLSGAAETLSPAARASYDAEMMRLGAKIAPAASVATPASGRSFVELSVMEKDSIWRRNPAAFERYSRDPTALVDEQDLPRPPLTASGKRFEQLSPLEKLALPDEQYRALRADWVRRGEPCESE